MSKEHNGDYLIDSFDVGTRYASGLDAINIAPEFGQIESEFYLEQCKGSSLFDDLYEICYTSGKWKKWILDLNRVSKEQIIITCCHYILSDQQFEDKIKKHFENADKLIQKKINSKLKLLNEQTKNYCI
jgi:Fic family protein